MVYNRLDDDSKPKGKQPVEWGENKPKQYDCVECDAYNMMCTGYVPLIDNKFVMPCKVKWCFNDGKTLDDVLDDVKNES